MYIPLRMGKWISPDKIWEHGHWGEGWQKERRPEEGEGGGKLEGTE